MTPTLPVDRRYRGCGRIHRRSGTRDSKTLAKILHMLEELESAGRNDLLRAVRDGQLVAVELWGAYRAKGLKGLPSLEHCQPLAATIEKWVMKADISVITRRNYGYCLDGVCAQQRYRGGFT